MIDFSCAIYRAVHRKSVGLADDVVFLTMTGSSMHCAGSLFERYMFAQ